MKKYWQEAYGYDFVAYGTYLKNKRYNISAWLILGILVSILSILIKVKMLILNALNIFIDSAMIDCAKDCIEAEDSDFAKTCKKEQGLFKCCTNT